LSDDLPPTHEKNLQLVVLAACRWLITNNGPAIAIMIIK
jgi:hypothetical protein